jgi:hypothetical protein
MSEDPKGFDAGDYNLFRYCHNDPIDFTDPMGLADQALPAGPNHASPLIELSKRQMWFGSSLGAIRYGMVEYSAQKFDHAATQFKTQSPGLMQDHYSHIPQLARLGLNRAIGSMIGVVGDPRNEKYFFGNFGLAVSAVTKTTEAFLTKNIVVGTAKSFSGRNASGFFASDHIRQILVNPATISRFHGSVPVELTHEGVHLAQGTYGDAAEYEAMRIGAGMGRALGLRVTLPPMDQVHTSYGY